MTTRATTKPMTAEEFFDFVQRPENADRWFELEQGEVTEMPPPGERHGVVCGNVALLLGLYVRRRKAGYVVCNDAGVLLERGPDTVRGPDVCYFEASRRFSELSPKFADQSPTLVVEVWSPTDRPGRMTRRVGAYLKAGVKVVWLIDPEARDVTVYRPGHEDKVYGSTELLVDEEALPGFRCCVAELFYSPGDEPGPGVTS